MYVFIEDKYIKTMNLLGTNGLFGLSLLGKRNLSNMYEVCKAFYHVEKQDQTLINYFMGFMKTYKLNICSKMSTSVMIIQKEIDRTKGGDDGQSQREKMAIMSFLVGLS